MRGYIAIDLPTKPYIKAYIIHRLGDAPKLRPDSSIGRKMYDILDRETNRHGYRKENFLYTVTIRVYISIETFRRRGGNLNETNLKAFNLFVETQIKEEYYRMMDDYMEVVSNFTAHLNEVRRKIGISDDEWSYDSMKKDYYRYRKSILKKNIA